MDGRGQLTAAAVIGTHDPGAEDESPTGGGYLALGRLLDCRRPINLDGDPLTEQEMTAPADAAFSGAAKRTSEPSRGPGGSNTRQ